MSTISNPNGMWPVMLTPFTESGAVDYSSLERLIHWYEENGADGLFAVCQSSEMFELSPQERVELAKFIINNTPKHMGVIASGHCAEKVEDQIREAQTVIDAGVDAYVFISMLRRSVAAFALKIFNPVPSTALHFASS